MGNVVSPKISGFSSGNSLGTFSYSGNNTKEVSFKNMSNEQKINYDYADDSKIVSADIKDFDTKNTLGTYTYVSKINSAINDSSNVANVIADSKGVVAGEKSRSIVEKQAEQKAKQEAEQKAKQEAEQKAKQEAEQKAKQEAEQKAKQEAEQKAKQEAEQKAKQEAEQKAKQEAEQKAKQEEEQKASNSTSVVGGKKMDIPSGDTSYKSYTNYRAVTNKSTTAYAINNERPMPYGPYKGQTFNVKTDNTGMRYIDKGDGKKYYTVAMGTYFGTEGDTFNIQTDKGKSFDVIIVDAKGSDSGTSHGGGTWYHQHGNSHDMVEFYIDSPDSIRVPGGTTGNYNYDSRFSGNVTSITKY